MPVTAAKWPIYPWLVALYPVLYLFSANMGLVRFSEVWPVALVTLAIVTVVFLALWAILKSETTAGAITGSLAFFFFSYGQVYNLVSQTALLRDIEPTFLHLSLILLAMGVLGIAIVATLKQGENLQELTHTINLTAVVLVALPTGMFGYYMLRHIGQEPPNLKIEIPPPLEPLEPDALPDIYLVILDKYPRRDELIEVMDYDNSEFLSALEDRGFYIADSSLSNYSTTPLSLASLLNMQYLDSFSDIREGKWGHRRIRPWLIDHAVGQALKERGYTYIHISSGWPPTGSNPFADINVEFTADGIVYVEKVDRASVPNTFLPLLLRTTLLRPFLPPLQASGILEWYHPDRTLQTFDTLGNIPDMGEPTFTFIHIIKPHEPYMFDQYGNTIPKPQGWTWGDDRNLDNQPAAFTGQLIFLNSLVLDTVDQILAGSDTPPLIIIQADHGYGSNRILNALYLPGGGDDLLYPSISPVNTFRLILDYYFGTDLGLLEDRSYLSPRAHDNPFYFVEIEE